MKKGNGRVNYVFSTELETIICDCGMEFVLLGVYEVEEEKRLMPQAGFYYCPYCGKTEGQSESEAR